MLAQFNDDLKKAMTCSFATRAAMVEGIKVGSTILVFDVNRRVYATKGIGGGGPIYRLHFQTWEIQGETSRSWIYGWNYDKTKVNKKSLAGFYSNECADRATWVQEHRYKIERAVGRVNHDQFDLLAGLADTLGLDLPKIEVPS